MIRQIFSCMATIVIVVMMVINTAISLIDWHDDDDWHNPDLVHA